MISFLWPFLFSPAHLLQVFCEKFLFSVEPPKEGSTGNRNLFSVHGLHKRADFAGLLRAMEALPQAP